MQMRALVVAAALAGLAGFGCANRLWRCDPRFGGRTTGEGGGVTARAGPWRVERTGPGERRRGSGRRNVEPAAEQRGARPARRHDGGQPARRARRWRRRLPHSGSGGAGGQRGNGGNGHRRRLWRGGTRHGRWLWRRHEHRRRDRGRGRRGQRPLQRQQRGGSVADDRPRNVQRDDLRRGRRRQDRQHHGDPGRADRGRHGGRRHGHGPVRHFSLGPDCHQQQHAPRPRVGRRAQDVADGQLPDERGRFHHLLRHLPRHRASPARGRSTVRVKPGGTPSPTVRRLRAPRRSASAR